MDWYNFLKHQVCSLSSIVLEPGESSGKDITKFAAMLMGKKRKL